MEYLDNSVVPIGDYLPLPEHPSIWIAVAVPIALVTLVVYLFIRILKRRNPQQQSR